MRRRRSRPRGSVAQARCRLADRASKALPHVLGRSRVAVRPLVGLYPAVALRRDANRRGRVTFRRVTRVSLRSIAVFNNKGGVGKTTLLCNLAAFLAMERNHKVLIIDADPQCNATQNLFYEDELEQIYDEGGFTVDSVIRPLASGKGFSDALRPRPSPNFALDVVAGDPKLALTEDLLATDWVQATGGNTRGLRTTFVFTQLLARCADYDYVFFDVGPSLGSINRAVLLGADFFITPMSIDIFSLRGIDNIAVSVDKWKKGLERGLADNDEHEELEVEDPGWRLTFAGYVTQQYTAKRDVGGNRRPVKAFEQIMREIPDRILKNLVRNQGLVQVDQLELGSIPTLHSLIPMSQSSRKPIFDLKASDGVVGAHFAKVKDYRAIIAGISDRLVANLQAMS